MDLVFQSISTEQVISTKNKAVTKSLKCHLVVATVSQEGGIVFIRWLLRLMDWDQIELGRFKDTFNEVMGWIGRNLS